MKKITIKEYFDSISYDYEKDTDSLKDIFEAHKNQSERRHGAFCFCAWDGAVLF